MAWQQSDLENLINTKQEEYQQLEFKRAEALAQSDRAKTEIAKDVSSFANTIGGTIIYGLAEDDVLPHAAKMLNPIDPSFSKEWLEQVINSRIQPHIGGIQIEAIQISTGANNGFAYRVAIPESDTVHQASDKRYYKRFNFASVPMEDYEVRQAMFRARRPSYRLVPRCRTSQVAGGHGIEYSFSATVINSSEISGRDCSIFGYIPQEWFTFSGQFPEYENVVVQNIPCRRLTGHREVRLAPGPTQLHLETVLSLSHNQLYNHPHLPMFFRIYDSFGLALFERYSFYANNSAFTLQESIEVGRKAATIRP